ARHGDRVAEHVVQPADAGARADLQAGLEQTHVVAVARAEHETVVAEGDGSGIPVRGRVANGDERHGRPVRRMHAACQQTRSSLRARGKSGGRARVETSTRSCTTTPTAGEDARVLYLRNYLTNPDMRTRRESMAIRRTVQHATIVVERSLRATPARV